MEEWRHFLEGARFQFEIWTDHWNLKYFMKAQKLNRRQARWALYLSRFNFKMIHKLGSSMGKADALSRRVDWKKGVENDNQDKTLLKPEWFEVRALERGHVLVDANEADLVKRIKESEAREDEVVKAVEEMKKAGVRSLRGEEWKIEEGLILWNGKVYVPKDPKLRTEIIRLHHDTPVGGHGGQWKTVELVTRNYWWP